MTGRARLATGAAITGRADLLGIGLLTQTRTLRGTLVPALFMELIYHLEHHLYPQVPSHRLATLAGRLDPFLAEA